MEDVFEWREVITKKKPDTRKWHGLSGREVNAVKIRRAAEIVESWEHQIIELYGREKLSLRNKYLKQRTAGKAFAKFRGLSCFHPDSLPNGVRYKQFRQDVSSLFQPLHFLAVPAIRSSTSPVLPHHSTLVLSRQLLAPSSKSVFQSSSSALRTASSTKNRVAESVSGGLKLSLGHEDVSVDQKRGASESDDGAEEEAQKRKKRKTKKATSESFSDAA